MEKTANSHKTNSHKNKWSTRMMINVSVLSVIAFVIMFIEVPMWFTPPFLKVDLSDIPALVGAFALGPIAGVAIEFLKNFLHMLLKGTSTMGVGELANFIIGSVFVYTAGMSYYKKRTFASAVRGLILGTIAMTFIAAIANYFFLIPFYAKLFGANVDLYVSMGAEVNSLVTDFKSFILFAIVPFNLLKGIVVSIAVMPLYKRLSGILRKY